MPKEIDIYNEIKQFNGQIENDQFDHKSTLNARQLVRHTIGFLNGYQKYGYLIIGYPDNAGILMLRNPLPFPIEEINIFRNELSNLLKENIDPPIADSLVDIVPIPLAYANNNFAGYIVVIKIQQSPNRPHAYLHDPSNLLSPNPKYYIRRRQGSGGDGCTGTMTPGELHQQIMLKSRQKISQYAQMLLRNAQENRPSRNSTLARQPAPIHNAARRDENDLRRRNNSSNSFFHQENSSRQPVQITQYNDSNNASLNTSFLTSVAISGCLIFYNFFANSSPTDNSASLSNNRCQIM